MPLTESILVVSFWDVIVISTHESSLSIAKIGAAISKMMMYCIPVGNLIVSPSLMLIMEGKYFNSNVQPGNMFELIL